MNKEEQDIKLLEWRDILNKLQLPFYLNQSSCLSLFRDGKPFDGNRSIDLGILATDLTEEKLEELKSPKYGYYSESTLKEPFKQGIMYYPGCEIQPVYFLGGKAIYNLRAEVCLVWDERHFLKKNWEKLTYLGLEWYIPGDTQHYLTEVYGKWWIPEPGWYWEIKAKNKWCYDEVMALGKPEELKQ